MESGTQQSLWNMDDERLKVINIKMMSASEALDSWDTELIYFSLYALLREASGKFAVKETEKLQKEMHKLNDLRLPSLKKRSPSKSEFWELGNDIYIEMNKLLKQHGLFFREGKDPRKTVINN